MQILSNQIGDIVDFIDNRVRYRGLIFNREGDNCIIVVLGDPVIHVQPLNRCVGVVSHKKYIALCNPK
jgi:hypothetical protein